MSGNGGTEHEGDVEGGRRFDWPGLLAHWTAVARASVAIPAGEEGDRWRQSVTPAITLQAVSRALEDLDALSEGEGRAFAQDRAEVLIRREVRALHEAWSGVAMPQGLEELVGEALLALEVSRSRGVVWWLREIGSGGGGDDLVVFPHPGEIVVALAEGGFEGDLMLPSPGVPVFSGSPVAFVRGPDGAMPEEEVVDLIDGLVRAVCAGGAVEAVVEDGPWQVYRQFDFAAGRATRDVVTRLDGEPQAGQPLLVCALDGGEARAVSLPPRAGARMEPVEVVRLDGSGTAAEG